MTHRATVLALALVAAVGLPQIALGLSLESARHLLSRTTFGASPSDIDNLLELEPDKAVTHLIESARREAHTSPPEWVDEPLPDRRSMRSMDQDQRAEMRKLWRKRGMELKTWWYMEMVTTDSPFTEKMTLFWHNHFTSSLRKVKSPQLLYRQNQLLRLHALGSFRELLHAVARDPAMLVYFDNHTNRVGNPNENFARELLELFTLGEGHYTEDDVKETARAFTGWGIDRQRGEHLFRPRQHDDGSKTILGVTGAFDGNAVIEILLEHPRTAEHITEKLWREFVDEEPPRETIVSLAEVFRRSDYDIATVLHHILTGPEFNFAGNRGNQIKSPVELLVGTIRTLNMPVGKDRLFARAGRGLGQDIFDPPNVKGWPGGEHWITSDSLLNRKHILERVIEAGDNMTEMSGSFLENWLADLDDDLRTARGVRSILLSLTSEPPNDNQNLALVIQDALRDPVYQLK